MRTYSFPGSSKTYAAIKECPSYTQNHRARQAVLSADLLFPAAFDVWIGRRTLETDGVATNAHYLMPATDSDYRACARALIRFPPLAHAALRDIGPELLMEYQQARAVNAWNERGAWWCLGGSKAQGSFADQAAAQRWAAQHGGSYELRQALWALRAGANRIRKEVQLAVRILRDARLWGQEEEDVFLRLQPVESEMVRALTIGEQRHFLEVAASRLEYRLIYQYAIVALQTTASTNEMRALRLGDVLLADRIIQVPPAGAKNKYRFRAIPLVTEDALWALRGLLARAQELGSAQPSHYLFPLRVTPGLRRDGTPASQRYDPSRPMSESGLKKQWEAVRQAAEMPWLRIYDLRHTGITRMAEAGVPLPVAMTFAGHMTRQMQQRYTAICMASQRNWGTMVWGDGKLSAEGAGARPPRKPVRRERGWAYQDVQPLHRRA